MSHRKISYKKIHFARSTSSIRRFFWILTITVLITGGSYMFFTYRAIGASFKVQRELDQVKELTISYQKAEEKYISRLENLRSMGEETLGLLPANKKIFVDRYLPVAKASP